MRTLSAAQESALESAHAKSHLRLEIEDAAATYQDLTSVLHGFGGFGSSVDQASITATFRLTRTATGTTSLSPLVSTAVKAGRGVRLYVTTVLYAVGTPDPGDLDLVFDGEIDRVDAGSDLIEVVCRDYIGATLADREIRDDSGVGGAGDSLEDVQAELLALAGSTGITLDADATGVTLSEVASVEPQMLLDAMRTVAGRIGWQLRPRWDETAGEFQLAFYEPPRSKATVDWTFGPDRYLVIPKLSEDRADIRNFIRVEYTDAATGERAELEDSDTASITAFGQRKATFVEADDSPINSAARAQELIDAALSDLALPTADVEVEVMMFWPVDIDDRITLEANAEQFTSDQTLAVVGYQHEYGPKRERTRITLRGKPTGGLDKWRSRPRRQRVTGHAELRAEDDGSLSLIIGSNDYLTDTAYYAVSIIDTPAAGITPALFPGATLASSSVASTAWAAGPAIVAAGSLAPGKVALATVRFWSNKFGWGQRVDMFEYGDITNSDSLGVSIRETSRTETTVTYTLTFGAAVTFWQVWTNEVEQPTSSDPWPTSTTPADSTFTTSTTTLAVDVPDPGYINYVQVVGYDATMDVRGTVVRMPVTPTLDAPDTIVSAAATVSDTDGSVESSLTAVGRTASYRYAFAVGSDPAFPSVATAEAGTVRTINVVDNFSLASDTVDWGEVIRFTALPYINADGTGTGNDATEHGEAVYWEAKRTTAAVGLEITDIDDSSDPAVVEVTVRDDDGLATQLTKQTRVGDGRWSAESVVSASPADDTAYTANVTLAPKKQSEALFHLDFVKDGQPLRISLPTGSIDFGKAPRITGLSIRLNEEADTADVVVLVDDDVASARCAASVSGTPSDGTVDGATAVNGTGQIEFTGILTGLGSGDVVSVKAIAYSAIDGGGAPSDYYTDSATYILQAADWENVVYTEGESSGSVAADLVDPAAQADDIYSRSASGTAGLTSWALVTASPVSGSTYTANVTLVEGHDSKAELRARSTVHGAQFERVAGGAPMDLGKAPKITAISLRLNEDDDTADAVLILDNDAASYRYLASTTAMPSDAAVDAEVAANGTGLVVLTGVKTGLIEGQEVFIKATAFSGASGAGEQSAYMTQQAVYRIVAAGWESVVVTEGTSSGSVAADLVDPAGQADDIYGRSASGTDTFGSWTLITASPVAGSTYTQNVTLVEKHTSKAEVRVRSTLYGEEREAVATSGPMDLGQIPDIRLTPLLNSDTGDAGYLLQGDPDTGSYKIAWSTSGTPSDTTVRAATAINNRVDTVTDALTLTDGQTAYFAAYGYSDPDGAGNESTVQVTAEITFNAVVTVRKPSLVVTNEETSNTGTMEVTLADPDGVADSITYTDSDGGSGTVTGSPVDTGVYNRTVTLEKGAIDWIILTLNYTIDGESLADSYTSAGFDPDASPLWMMLDARVDVNGVATLKFRGDFDTGSYKVLGAEGAMPTDANVRLETAINASSGTYDPSVTLANTETAHFKIIGYSDPDGAGEEGEIGTDTVTYSAPESPRITSVEIIAYDDDAGSGDVEWEWVVACADANSTDHEIKLVLKREGETIQTETGLAVDSDSSYTETGAANGTFESISVTATLSRQSDSVVLDTHTELGTEEEAPI